MPHTRIDFEFGSQIKDADDLHELLCLAVHEQDLDALKKLSDNVVDIGLPEGTNTKKLFMIKCDTSYSYVYATDEDVNRFHRAVRQPMVVIALHMSDLDEVVHAFLV